jgi:putative ATP-binding cassette transporter
MELVMENAEILEMIHQMGLDDVLKRAGGLDTERDWDDMLSIGEQHLISITRIFLAKPAFVFLDRPGSALPQSQISTILDLLAERGIGVVVLSKNGESHLRYDAVVELKPDGSWEVHRELANPNDSELHDLNC